MSLQFNQSEARKGDSFSSIIRETGKYVGVITRAEKLVSEKGTQGVGLSFKDDNGATASYLDVYTAKANGESLWGANLIQSLLCCLRLKSADEGRITFDKWDKEVREMVKVDGTGYPSIMGKRVGLILQKELSSHHVTGADVEKVVLVGVFEVPSGLTATEILDSKTKPERVEAKLKALLPVRDVRKKQEPLKTMAQQQKTNVGAPFDDDIPF